MSIYNDLRQNDLVDFEMNFVGPNVPDYELPENLHFTHSTVKPAQAIAIAASQTKGSYLVNTADDTILGPHFLDRLYEASQQINDDKVIVSSAFAQAGTPVNEPDMHYQITDPNSPLVTLCGFYSKTLFDALGGYDRRFIGLYWDLDKCLRVYGFGGRVHVLFDLVTSEEICADHGSGLSYRQFPDHILLRSLWSADGRTRLEPVEEYEWNDTILTVSQGTKGDWQ
jgi:GT2 family glycosyltransferase